MVGSSLRLSLLPRKVDRLSYPRYVLPVLTSISCKIRWSRLLGKRPGTFSQDRLNRSKMLKTIHCFTHSLGEQSYQLWNTPLLYVPPRKKKCSCDCKMYPDLREVRGGRRGMSESMPYRTSKLDPSWGRWGITIYEGLIEKAAPSQVWDPPQPSLWACSPSDLRAHGCLSPTPTPMTQSLGQAT